MNKQLKLTAAILILLQGIFIDSALAQGKHGAIAISSDRTTYGLASNRSTRAEAKKEAISKCGAGCEVVITLDNECGAVVKDNYTWYSGRGDTEGEAKERAFKACGKTSCKLVKSVCSK
ncbi:DUF4189 domain-containing protein [Hydrocoleum sp. CS-953]|uniref:DUF4189 domain-containing protein n=1 Tax=Microcoleaceae TaxID=1892252 RepID=UPI000B9A8372|nr:DUF4189 domain-containing protein [Hydrocoleum sp. CS-953]OZH51301.1 hypothetical protein AFK68_32030 [Hydrocoleum sp. CS-953]